MWFRNAYGRFALLALLGGLLAAMSGRAADQPVLFVGDNPDQVYRKINRARWRIDPNTVLACTSRRAQVSVEEMRKKILQGRSSLPGELHLLDVDPSERVTTLYYLGIREDRYDTGKTFYWYGSVTLVKEEGTWRLRHETWKSIPPPFPDPDE